MAANPSIQLGTDGNWAIKEDNLLAYKKDGDRFFNKEFDFTRGSLATFVDKDGLIKISGVTDTELVTNGNFDSDSDWIKGTGWSIANGRASYDGTGGTSFIRQNDVIEVGKTYKVTLEVLANEGSGINTIFLGGTVLNSSHLSVGSYTFYGSTNNTAVFLTIYGRSGEVFEIDNVSVKEVQLETPRIDFTDDATGHLLLEPQSTNLIPYSENFSSWSKTRCTVTSNQAISPDGTLNADLMTSTGDDARLEDQVGSSGAEYTQSIYVKSAQVSDVNCRIDFAGANIVNFTANQQWQRIETTLTNTSVNPRVRIRILNSGNSIYVWGAQLEQKSFKTSYIPTQGGAVTRNLEVCTNSGGSVEDFNGEEGVLFIDVARFKNDLNYLTLRLSQDNSEYNEVAFKFRNTEGFIFARTIKDGVSRGFIEYTFPPGEDDSLNKLAFSYQENSCSLWVNGQNVGNFSGPSNSAQGTLKYLQLARGSGEPFYGKVKNVQVFKRVLSDGELYLLTVPQYQSYQEMATALNYTL